MNDRKSRTAKVLAYINILVTAAALLIVSVVLLAFERPTVSETERRQLEEFPEFSVESLISGEYTKQLVKYYTDTVPSRDTLKNVSASLLEYTGLRLDDVKIHGATVIDPAEETTGEEHEWWNETDDVTVTPEETTAPDETEPDETTGTGETSDDVTDEPDTDGETTVPEETTADDTTKSEETTRQEETTQPHKQPDTKGDKDDAAVSNGVIVVGTRGMTLYGGSRNFAAGYVATLKNYRASVGDSVNLYAMPIPTAVGFYLPEKYKAYSASQSADLDYLRSIWDPSAATFVDVYPAILPHVDEPIYSRTDHHWQPLGAYYAAREFAATAGVPFAADLENQYEKVVVPNYVGTLYSFTQDVTLLNNPEDFVYYKGKNSYETYYYDTAFSSGYKSSLFFNIRGGGAYCSFLGTDDIIAVIKTDCHNGRKLMIIKDSFGNALVPFLTNSFEEIYVTDLRYFEPNAIQFMKDNGITDVLFALCMQDVFGGWMKNLEMIRTQ